MKVKRVPVSFRKRIGNGYFEAISIGVRIHHYKYARVSRFLTPKAIDRPVKDKSSIAYRLSTVDGPFGVQHEIEFRSKCFF
jgi:hypothetical protein